MRTFVAVACLIISLSLAYADQQRLEENQNYILLPSLAELSSNDTLVCRYQSRSCQVLLNLFIARNLDITLKPIILRESWRTEAKLMLMANKLNFSLSQHYAIAQQLNQSPLPTTSQQMVDLLSGVAPDQPLEAIEQAVFSTALPRELKDWQMGLQNYPISSVPTMLYQGQFLISAEQAKTARQFLETMDLLKPQ